MQAIWNYLISSPERLFQCTLKIVNDLHGYGHMRIYFRIYI